MDVNLFSIASKYGMIKAILIEMKSMEKLKQLPKFTDDQDIAAFMETHDGFELAEIVETPDFQRQGYVELASETLTLLDDLVPGICKDRERSSAPVNL